jgi:hypothetical protein
MKISMDKKYTSNGKSIKILCTDRNDLCPVIGLREDGGVYFFYEDGRNSIDTMFDLVEEVWTPTEGEWCWFWDTDEDKNATLSRFQKVCDNGKIKSQCGNFWEYCSKFDGELPKHLKRL